jgi:hypothetical protein
LSASPLRPAGFRLAVPDSTREIIHNFTMGVSGYDSDDDRPPTEGVSSNGVGATLWIGWKF